MSVEFFNVTRRMALIKLTGGSELRISRSRKDGTTVGIMVYGKWKTLEINDLLDALSYVCKTDEELLKMGLPETKVKPTKKRDYKAEYARRKAKLNKNDDDDIAELKELLGL